MCLITEQKEPFIADKDITVYKILDEDLLSPYQSFQYEEGELNETDLLEDSDWCAYDDQCSTYLDNKFPGWKTYNREELKCIGEGFHSFMTKERADKTSAPEYLFTCTIPKGSEYYLDATGLCVSNKIIIH